MCLGARCRGFDPAARELGIELNQSGTTPQRGPGPLFDGARQGVGELAAVAAGATAESQRWIRCLPLGMRMSRLYRPQQAGIVAGSLDLMQKWAIRPCKRGDAE
jgi:hypothetical protein